MPRKIIHLDLDAFFCAVEEKRRPELRGKPFAVGGQPDERGVVSSCSYAARQYGVRSAMPMSRAMRLCPGLVILRPNFQAYSQASHQVMERLHQVTPLVEQISIDEAFLDVSDLSDEPDQVAGRIQKQIRDELELPCSLGIATNKLVAKIATDFGKAANRGSSPPNALTRVQPGEEAAFLAELPTIALWGIGPKTAARMAELGIKTIGQLSRWSEPDLVRLFGKNGHDLYRHARGVDDRPVETSHEVKSISRETTFARDIGDPAVLDSTLHELAESVGKGLQKEGLEGVTVKLKLRWPDFTTLTRQVTLSAPTHQVETIYQSAKKLFGETWQASRKVRLIGIGVSGFEQSFRQLSLWEAKDERQTRLENAVDELRQRFGENIIHRGPVS